MDALAIDLVSPIVLNPYLRFWVFFFHLSIANAWRKSARVVWGRPPCRIGALDFLELEDLDLERSRDLERCVLKDENDFEVFETEVDAMKGVYRLVCLIFFRMLDVVESPSSRILISSW
jgi:hypothetical protein